MTIEKANSVDSAEKRRRVAPACEIFDMLTTHAEQYRAAITISKVQNDIEATFGVRLDRGAISSRLRNIANKGLIVRAANGRGWWVFSDRVQRDMGRKKVAQRPRKPGRKQPRGLLKQNHSKKGTAREFVEQFIRANKLAGQELIFTKESISNFTRLNGSRAVNRRQLRKIAKALGNMVFQQAGLVKTNQPGIYCVPADETRFNKSAVSQPDVSTPRNVSRTGAKKSNATELRKLFQEAAEGYATVQQAMIRLSDLIGNFKE